LHTSINIDAVKVLLEYVNSITRGSGKFGVKVPGLNTDLITLRHAALLLGMESYVRHFAWAYKSGLRDRTPPMTECDLLERSSARPTDDLVTAMSERLAYLRRRKLFNANSIQALLTFLASHDKIREAVANADLRVRRNFAA
jgi:hypothetical protein